MAFVADLDEVTYDAELDGEQVRRTVVRRAWEGRGWATVMMVFEERARDGGWKPAKLTVLRFRRAGEGWKKHAQVTLPADHARALQHVLGEHAGRFAGVDGADDED